ncbi:MAG: DUF58 domain-containing protein [Pseudomonadota bacterium]
MTQGRATLEKQASQAASLLPELMAAAEHAAAVVTAGRHPRQRAGASDTFWQFRDYSHGDPVSSIDWRQSARLDQRLLVRQTEWEQPQTLLLWCDGDDDFDYTAGGRPRKRFRGQVIALATAILALRSGERVGLWGQPGPARAGVAQMPALAEHLFHQQADLRSLPAQGGATVLLISDFHTEPQHMVDAFTQVRNARGRAIAVVVEDPSEAAFPFEGSTRFESPSGAFKRQFGNAGAVRETYRNLRAAHHGALRAAAIRPQDAVFFHTTDEPVTPLLMQIALRIEKEG